ncbi:hypothetical protein ACQPZZ_12790 [Microbispora sp. CA-135349]|uniref:hypothetical protein n=1 Tax=Microbispora sp. CA-135349 TaxID=3239953 RepID=UPI003D8F610D
MGTVWGGHDRVLGRRVAIKLIRFPEDRPDPEMERRFDREAQVMAQLNHPGAPTIYDLGAFDDPVIGRRLFLVMEFVEGVTLEDVIANTDRYPSDGPLHWAPKSPRCSAPPTTEASCTGI